MRLGSRLIFLPQIRRVRSKMEIELLKGHRVKSRDSCQHTSGVQYFILSQVKADCSRIRTQPLDPQWTSRPPPSLGFQTFLRGYQNIKRYVKCQSLELINKFHLFSRRGSYDSERETSQVFSGRAGIKIRFLTSQLTSLSASQSTVTQQ